VIDKKLSAYFAQMGRKSAKARMIPNRVGAPISAWSLTDGVLATPPFAQSAKVDSGHSPVISANRTTDGILWQLTGSNYQCV
jgi:hypothetical protein